MIDSLKIVPSNPTINDSIKIINFTSFPNDACFLKNSYLNINGKEIVINATHFEGGFTVICNSIDTIIIGKLDTGAYTLYYNLSVDTNTAIFDTDTLFFVVQNPTDVFGFLYETSQIQIHPNPFTYETKIKYNLPDNTTDAALTIYNIVGEKIEVYKLNDKNGELIIDASNLSQGLYILYIKNNQGFISNKRMLIVR